jgi:hypothetical protein
MVEHLDPETSPITQWFDLIYLHREADDICGKSRELLTCIKAEIENRYLKNHKIFFPEEYNFSENELETLRFLKTLPKDLQNLYDTIDPGSSLAGNLVEYAMTQFSPMPKILQCLKEVYDEIDEKYIKDLTKWIWHKRRKTAYYQQWMRDKDEIIKKHYQDMWITLNRLNSCLYALKTVVKGCE